MRDFQQFLLAKEAIEFPNEQFVVRLHAPYIDQPTLSIDGWGSIRLFYSGSPEPHWVVHMIESDRPGGGTLLYFAALLWALDRGDKLLGKEPKTFGRVASDSTLSPDAIRARLRMQNQYGDYLMIMPHMNADSVKVHRKDGSNWRRPATSEEAATWRLKKMPPFEFKFV